MSCALCNFGDKKRGVGDDIKYTQTSLKIVRLGIAQTHGWVELALTVPTSSSHRSSTVIYYLFEQKARVCKLKGNLCTAKAQISMRGN